MQDKLTRKIKNLPNFKNLNLALKGYFATDTYDIEELIQEKFSSLYTQIPMLPLRFFYRFINEKASLFSNNFERLTDNSKHTENIDYDELTNAEIWAERYYHLFRMSAMHIGYDDNKDKLVFTALDPTMYFYDRENGSWFIKISENKVVAYIKKGELGKKSTNSLNDSELVELEQKPIQNKLGEQAGVSGSASNHEYSQDSRNYLTSDTEIEPEVIITYDVYESIGVDFETLLHTFDYNLSAKDNKLKFVDTIEEPPFVEWRDYRIKIAIPHELAKLQRDYISLFSWGFYNIAPKLLTQLVVKSSEDTEKLQQTLAKFGSTTTAIKVGNLDTVEVFDTGDIRVLKDLFEIYTKQIEQSALQEGVDKNAIVSSKDFRSGEAKKVELGYINHARNNFKIPARLFEKALFEKINSLYKLDFGYRGIVFHDLELASDPVNDLEYATAMYINHFWTYEQAYAFINKVSLEKAKELIDKYNLEPPQVEVMRTQVSDTVMKAGKSAPMRDNTKADMLV